MAKSKLNLENSNLVWNPERRYKVNEIVTYFGKTYQNLTGKNSEPEVGSDWFVPEYSIFVPYTGAEEDVDLGEFQLRSNGAIFTGSVVVPSATQSNQAVNLGQLNSVHITVEDEFYYDENNVLRPNISTYRQVEITNTAPIPIITLDFEPTFIQSVNLNGKILTQNQYIYTAPNQLDLSTNIADNPKTIEIIYEHFINEPNTL